MYDIIRDLKTEIEENLSIADQAIPLKSDGDISPEMQNPSPLRHSDAEQR